MSSVARGVVYSFLTAAVSVWICKYCLFQGSLSLVTPVYVIVTGVSALLSLTYGYLAYKFLDQRTSPFHTYTTALTHTIVLNWNDFYGRYLLGKYDQETARCRALQQDLLFHILRCNADTEHGKKFGFKHMKSRVDFCKNHPLTRYESYRKNIERIAKGEVNILTRNKTIHLSVTSGTTGGESVFPVSRKFLRDFFKPLFMALCEMYRCVPDSKSLQKVLWLRCGAKRRFSEAGIPTGPVSASFYRTGSAAKLLQAVDTAPSSLSEILREPESLYVMAVFGLRDRTVGTIAATFCESVYSLFITMETKWRQMVKDIASGKLDSNLNIPGEVRQNLNGDLRPDSKRAEELEREFGKGFYGIARRLWPLLNFISAINTGSMKPYGLRLNEYYAPGVPIMSYMYSASEGVIGVNAWPLEQHSYYCLLPTSNFYEFIPVGRCEGVQPPTCFSEELEVGKEYEIVLTNEHGLYRYRLGDVLKVVRYHNDCPVVEFMYRRGQLLNIRGEKTSEVAVYSALQDTLTAWNELTLVDYTSAESVMLDSVSVGGRFKLPHYVIFLEVRDEENDGDVRLSQEQLELFDGNLRRHALVYDMSRANESIAPATVHIMQAGAFTQLRHYMVSNTSSSSTQSKIPRVLKRKGAVAFMVQLVAYSSSKR